MPTTVTASNGNVYHLFQLACSVKDYSEDQDYTTLDNELSDGYWSQVLYGSDTGIKFFTLSLPTLTDSALDTVTGPNGETLTRRAYIRALHAHTIVEGKPFVIQSVESGQYYLVRFVDRRLSLQRMLVKLFSTGVPLKQVRLDGVTVFSFENESENGYALYDETGHNSPAWERTDFTGAVQLADMSSTGDVVFAGNPQNGHNTVRLNGSASTGFLSLINAFDPAAFNDIFIAMKMREDTFSNDCGILTKNTGTALLLGDSSETKFQNLALSGFEYRLNGALFEQADMQAPMNAFGIVHLRFETQQFGTNWQFGKDRGTAGTFAKADIGQVVICSNGGSTPISRIVAREITEHLIIKWGAGT